MEDNRKEVIIQKKLTNKLKRILKKTQESHDGHIINTRNLMMTLFNLGIANGKDLSNLYAAELLLLSEHKKEITKLMCIRKTRRYGRKYSTWVEVDDEQMRKESDKRDRRIESQIREIFYRSLTQVGPDTQSSVT